MPFYEYQCSNCGHHLEEMQSMSAKPLTKCPKCGKNTLKKLIGTGSGLIFKGSGFYLTDYKKQSSKTAEKNTTEKPAAAKSKDTSSQKSASGESKKTTSNKKESK